MFEILWLLSGAVTMEPEVDLAELVKRQQRPEAVAGEVDRWLPELRKKVYDSDNSAPGGFETDAFVLVRYEFEALKASRSDLTRNAAHWRLQKALQCYFKTKADGPDALRRRLVVRGLFEDPNIKGSHVPGSEQARYDLVYKTLFDAISPASNSKAHEDVVVTPFRKAFTKATTALPKAWIVLMQAE